MEPASTFQRPSNASISLRAPPSRWSFHSFSGLQACTYLSLQICQWYPDLRTKETNTRFEQGPAKIHSLLETPPAPWKVVRPVLNKHLKSDIDRTGIILGVLIYCARCGCAPCGRIALIVHPFSRMCNFPKGSTGVTKFSTKVTFSDSTALLCPWEFIKSIF